LVLASLSYLLEHTSGSLSIDNELIHLVVKELTRVAYIDGSFNLVTSEDPDLDASIFHELDGIPNTVL
jgi:hypothetical protein